jgi:hypothetical protein
MTTRLGVALSKALNKELWLACGMEKTVKSTLGPVAQDTIKIAPWRKVKLEAVTLFLYANGTGMDEPQIEHVISRDDLCDVFVPGQSLTLCFEHEEVPLKAAGLYLLFSHRFLGLSFAKPYRVLYFPGEGDAPSKHTIELEFV